MKNPAIAQVLVMAAFFRYLVVLENQTSIKINPLFHKSTNVKTVFAQRKGLWRISGIIQAITFLDAINFTYRNLPLVDLTSLAANRNWMAQTSRQERLSERVREHMATVTWYTVPTSSSDRNWSRDPGGLVSDTGGDGRIFNKKTREPVKKGFIIQ